MMHDCCSRAFCTLFVSPLQHTRDFVSSGLETQGSNTTWDDADAEEAMELHTAADLEPNGRVSDFDSGGFRVFCVCVRECVFSVLPIG